MALGAFRHAGLISNTHHKITISGPARVWKKPFVNATARGEAAIRFRCQQVKLRAVACYQH